MKQKKIITSFVALCLRSLDVHEKSIILLLRIFTLSFLLVLPVLPFLAFFLHKNKSDFYDLCLWAVMKILFVRIQNQEYIKMWMHCDCKSVISIWDHAVNFSTDSYKTTTND